MSLGRYIDRAVKLEVSRQIAAKQSLVNGAQKAEDPSGTAEVTKLNSDGTVNVKIRGQEVTNVQPGSRPIGLGSTVILGAGKKLVF